MRFVYRVRVGCDDLGKRVTVRWRAAHGRPTDTVGTLHACDERAFVILNKRGERVEVERASILAAKVIGDPRPPLGGPA